MNDVDLKQIYEKMVDYRYFGIVLLTVGAFFYLGIIIPSAVQSASDSYISTAASTGSLLLSIVFFRLSKSLRKQLIETEEGQEYITKQKRP